MDLAACRRAVFLQPAARDDRGRVVSATFAIVAAVLVGLGMFLQTLPLPPVERPQRAPAHRVSFRLPALAPAAPAPAALPELTRDTVLAQAAEEPRAAPELAPTAAPPEFAAPEAVRDEPPPRRVYGVRQVLVRGLGDGGGAGGLVVKLGNTLDGVADTLTASAADLRGELAALSSVERAPEPVHQVKPHYSPAMLAARARGVVTARLLVDADGSVAEVAVLEDIGQDSRRLASDAFRQFRFRPALRHGEPVAVWIVFRMRFEFQE